MVLHLPLNDSQLASARSFTLEQLPQLTDSDPNEMSEYTIGLLQSSQHDSADALRQYVTDQLLDLLESHTEAFVSSLWHHLESAANGTTGNAFDHHTHNTESDDLYAGIDTSAIPPLEEDDAADDDDESDDRDRRRQDRYADEQQQPQHQPAEQFSQRNGQHQHSHQQRNNKRPQRQDSYQHHNGDRHQHNNRQRQPNHMPTQPPNGQHFPPPVQMMQQMMQMQQMQQQTPDPSQHTKPPPTSDATSLFATNIPPEQCTMMILSQWFGMFGDVKSIKVIGDGKAEIQFTTPQHAAAAINSPAAVFNNRHIKLMWNKFQPRAANTRQQQHAHNHQQQQQHEPEATPQPQPAPKSASDVAAEIAARRQANASPPEPAPTAKPAEPQPQKRPQSPSDAAAKAEQLHALRQQLITKQVNQQKEMLAKLEANKATMTADEKSALMSKIKELSVAIKGGVAKQQQQQTATNATVKKQRLQ